MHLRHLCRGWCVLATLLIAGCTQRAAPAPAPRSANTEQRAKPPTEQAPDQPHLLPERIAGSLSFCIDLDGDRRGEIVPGEREADKLPTSPPWLEALPGSEADEVHDVEVTRISSSAGQELWVSYVVGGPGRPYEQANLAVYHAETHELLVASTPLVMAPPAELSCFGNARTADVNCDGHQDILVLRTCHDTACPENDSSDAECRGPVSPHDVAHVWDPKAKRYTTYRPTAERDAEADCFPDDGGSVVIFCGPRP